MQVEQQETQEQKTISVQVPSEKNGKRVRVIVQDEDRPRPKPAPRQHISFRFADTQQTGLLRLVPANLETMTMQEMHAALHGAHAVTVLFADFYTVLRERGGLSDQLPLRVQWMAEGAPRLVDFDFNAPGYMGQNSWPFEWDGRRCALTVTPNHYYVEVYQCNLAQALQCLANIREAMPLHHQEQRNEKRKELLVSVPLFNPLNQTYAWRSLSARNRRSMDTLYLPTELKQALLHKLERFRDSQALYDQYGITWKFAVLLSGPPGCGKTSSVLALCSHFGWNLGKLTLEPRFTSQDLEQMLQKLPEGAALLLEDVDALFVGREAKTGVDCSTILNLLDGVATRRGLVIFMTSNHPELLDGALTRDGRVDCHARFPEAGLDEKRQLVLRMSNGRWSPEECERLLKARGDESMAALQSHMFECIKDERAALY